MNKWLGTISALLVTANVWAGGEINHLDVNDGIVVFATSETKTGASPTCMATDQADKWAISINSESGRAIYSLLMTAMVTKMTINVESADDCADAEGFERAKRVWLNPAIAAGESASLRLAPDLTYEGNSARTISNLNTTSELTPVLELTGKQVVQTILLAGLTRENVKVRLTIDSEVIWDYEAEHSGNIWLLGNPDYNENVYVEESMLLEVQMQSDPSINVSYRTRPIK